MNAETRAKDTAKIINASGDDLDLITDFGQLVIATAIRQAENDKLEEAARVAEQAHLGVSCFVDAVDCGQFNSGVRHAAKAVRSLKPKD